MSGYYTNNSRAPQKRSASAGGGRYSSGNGRKYNSRKKKKGGRNYGRFFLFLLVVTLLTIGIVSGVNALRDKKTEKIDDKELSLNQEDAQQPDIPVDSLTFYPGISVNGVDLSGMTYDQAVSAVNAQMTGADHMLTLVYQDQNYYVGLLGGSDMQSVLDEAYALGRSGTPEENRAKIESLKTEPVNLTVERGYSLPDMTSLLEDCAAIIEQKPKNATVKGYENGSFVYEDGRMGIELDREATIAAAQAAVDAGKLDTEVGIVVKETAPEMDKATLKEKFVKLGSFTTTTTSNKNRNTNIRLCSSALHGTIVQPGEEFSVNAITGKRSESKGYMDATVIKNGVYIQEPGGGVCQVSSTLFNAVVRAGFKITERHNHTIVSSYVPIGEDAAIDYPSKDFRFKNNSAGPIAVLFNFDESNKKLKATVYGIPILEKGIELDLNSEVVSTIPIPSPKIVQNPSLKPGAKVTATTGLEGQKVKTYLITKKNGKETGRELLYSSNYPVRTPVIEVNDKATPKPSDSIPSEKPTESSAPESEATPKPETSKPEETKKPDIPDEPDIPIEIPEE